MLTKESIQKTALAEHQLAMWYLGQVGFLFLYRGKTILIDGYLSDYVDRNCSNALLSWVRRYPVPLDPCSLDFVDAVLCSHAHEDHTDPDTIKAILSVNDHACFIGTHAVADRFLSLGVPGHRIAALDNDASIRLSDDIVIKNVPSAHEELHPDANGQYEEGGFLLTFGVGLDAISVYHAGDGCPWDGLESRLRGQGGRGPDIAILPVNGRDYYRRHDKNIIGNFDCVEAITLAQHIGADYIFPVHIDLYDVNALNPAIFVDILEKQNPKQNYHIFRPGERMIYAKE